MLQRRVMETRAAMKKDFKVFNKGLCGGRGEEAGWAKKVNEVARREGLDIAGMSEEGEEKPGNRAPKREEAKSETTERR